MKVDIVVNVQRYVNYGERNDYWKPKGGHTFIFPVDDDFLLNDNSMIVEAIEHMLGNESNYEERYTYLSHHIEFSQPTRVEGLEETFELIFGEAK